MKLARCVKALCALIVVGLASAWVAVGQEGQPEPGTSPVLSAQENLDHLASLRDQAEQAVQAGDYAQAASILQQASDPLLQLSGQLAGDQAPQTAESYDPVIATAARLLAVARPRPENRLSPQAVQTRELVRDVLREALIGKLKACSAQRLTEDARRTIQEFRAYEPEYHHLREILPVQAGLEGRDASVLTAAEGEAARLSDQAKWAWKGGDAREALRLADEAISRHPDAGGAWLARDLKVRILERQKKHAERKAVCLEIIDRFGPFAPLSDLVLNARCEVAWLDGVALHKSLIARKQKREPTTPAEFEQVRQAMRAVATWDREPKTRVHAYEVFITSLYWEPNYPATVEACDQFLARYSDPKDLALYGREASSVRVMAVDALWGMGRLADALTHMRWVMSPDHPLPVDNDAVRASLQYRYWWLLLRSGAATEEVEREAEALRTRFPGSALVDVMDEIIAEEVTRHTR